MVETYIVKRSKHNTDAGSPTEPWSYRPASDLRSYFIQLSIMDLIIDVAISRSYGQVLVTITKASACCSAAASLHHTL